MYYKQCLYVTKHLKNSNKFEAAIIEQETSTGHRSEILGTGQTCNHP